MVRIVEILGRSTQGITRPFLCRTQDGKLFYVKGKGAGARALVCEWVAGNLGRAMDLPLPHFEQLEVPPELIEFSARPDIHELGSGIVFGSQLIEAADELSYLFIEQIDWRIRARILLYDWWIQNSDRTLTEAGGNPNLLFRPSDHRLYIIDHNLAFDEGGMSGFWEHHAFHESVSAWTEEFKESMEKEMNDALLSLPSWWGQIPPPWLEFEVGLTLDSVSKSLSRFQKNSAIFWRSW